jgi:glutamate N-acetyltransferase/amino-acid N-acetyltransferase
MPPHVAPESAARRTGGLRVSDSQGRPGSGPEPPGLATAEPPLESFSLAPGFRAAAAACGLKPGGAPDLALVVAEAPCAAAGVFTTNRVQAAPVLLDREHLERGAARVRAVIANSGCANACTGPGGLEDARAMAALAARSLNCEPGQVLVLSTGVIGRRLDMAKLGRGIALVTSANAEPGAAAAARAILTTDTHPKVARADVAIGGRTIAIRGFAKGAGMIHPDMATMLAVLTTDAGLAPGPLQAALTTAVRRSFNRISVDGDMSTNDTVLLLASGAAGPVSDPAGLEAFGLALTRCCIALARQIARDGEGATRLVEIVVSGAATEEEGHRVADAIARSALVKTAIHGADPNWGRILAAAGASGVAIEPARLRLELGAPEAAVRVVEGGLPLGYDEAAASATLQGDPVHVRLDLGQGAATATVWTCDLSAEYVAINAHYTT